MKSFSVVTFGEAFGQSSASKGAPYKARNNHQILRKAQKAALSNRENNKLELRMLKQAREAKVWYDKAAKDIMRLRERMNELRAEEKQKDLEARKLGQSDYGVARETRKRKYLSNGESVETIVEDDRPVAKRTRSSRNPESASN